HGNKSVKSFKYGLKSNDFAAIFAHPVRQRQFRPAQQGKNYRAGAEPRKRSEEAMFHRPTGERDFNRMDSLANPDHQISQVKTGPTQTRSAQVIQQ
ncbi:MAG: hypothetical protein KBH45_10185, partial [Verrucomicrobia bacterium]|nr:hypothetical protein [Verrucomicrobiota bacterium]